MTGMATVQAARILETKTRGCAHYRPYAGKAGTPRCAPAIAAWAARADVFVYCAILRKAATRLAKSAGFAALLLFNRSTAQAYCFTG